MTSHPHRHLTRRRVAVAAAALTTIALAIPGAAAAARSTARAPRTVATSPRALVAVTAAPRLASGTRVLGAVEGTSSVSGAVALRLPDPAAVTAFIDRASSPRSASFHHYLSRGTFARRFGPTPSAVAAVRSQPPLGGLVVTGVSSNHLLVQFRGTAARAEATFHTGLLRVRLASGAIGQATTTAAHLPAAVARYVQAVIGLDQLVHETNGLARAPRTPHRTPTAVVPHTGNGGPIACASALSQQQFGALTDQQVAASYGAEPLYSAGDLASGQTIDVYELEPFLTSDVAGFDQCYFGADHTSQLSTITVDGGPGAGAGSGEAALDVEDVSAIAPAAHIHVFSGPNMDNPFGPLDTWNAIAVADDAGQVTSSWGLCETELQEGAPGVAQVENEIFQQTAAQGQTIFASAGDDGSDDCAGHASTPVSAVLSVDDPSSQPYVTSVGGTTILNATEPPVESVWNNGNDGGAGGGGISELWAMQPWQASAAVPQTSATEPCSNDPGGTADNFHLAGVPTTLSPGTLCREAPDVSALADPQTGITIEFAGQWFQIGGTSSSAPLWAAMLAEVNGSTGCTGLSHGVGFADPLLYDVASSSATDATQAFSDVTMGNNDNLGVGGAVDWQAGTGFDLATGLGTPRLTDANGAPGLAAQLCTLAAGTGATPPPVVTGLTSTSGSSAGGGTLTIDGTHFGATTGSVYFGNVTATVVGWTATAVMIDVPAYHAPAGSPPGTSGSADVTVVTAGLPPLSSAPGPSAVYHYTASTAGHPVVDYVSAPSGPTAGGGTVEIVGAGLSGATSVHFGDVAATINGAASNSDNELSVTVPTSDGVCAVPATQGDCAVAVTVTTPGGTSVGAPILPAYQGPVVFNADGSFTAPAGCSCEIVAASDEYDYAPTPTISSIAPALASENGGTTVTVTGTGFNLLDLEWENVGTAGQNANEDFSLEGITATTLTFALPGAAPTTEEAAVPVSVQTGGGVSNTTTVDYAGTPQLGSISKHVAAQANPGTLVVTGSGFSDVDQVVFQLQEPFSFLSSTSTAITAQSDTSLTVGIPQGYTFPADVLVCSVTGCSAPNPATDSLTLAYAGRPVVHSSSPSSGPAHGGTTVTIQGALDSEVTAVHFGTALATIESEPEVTASGPITVLAPAGTAGHKVNVTISTLGGTLVAQPTSATTTAATFTYAKSSPTAPRGLKVTTAVRALHVSWSAPSDDGGAAVTGYVVIATSGHTTVTVHVSATARKATVSHLSASSSWEVTVQAVNRYGRGLAASAGPFRPTS